MDFVNEDVRDNFNSKVELGRTKRSHFSEKLINQQRMEKLGELAAMDVRLDCFHSDVHWLDMPHLPAVITNGPVG